MRGLTPAAIKSYRAAIVVACESSYMPYDTTESYDEITNPFILKGGDSPEDLYIKRESFLKLSDSAKLLVQLILSGPNEVTQEITNPKHGSLSRTRLRTHLHKTLRWRHKKIDDVTAEIREALCV